jgi:predicted metal-dependent hydrolase
MTALFVVDDLAFAVRWSASRRTLQITVDRDGELVLFAPRGCNPTRLERFVKDKRYWVYTKLAQKETLSRPRPHREFVSGEGFRYLGRSYRLLIVEEQEAALRLVGGRFLMRREDAGSGWTHFVRWYRQHALAWLAPRVPRFATRMGVAPSTIDVRDLGHRWGSCSGDGVVRFHWATMTLPPSIVDYVVVHELGHLAEPNHSTAFWQCVERVLPDAGARKQWLAQNGGDFGVGGSKLGHVRSSLGSSIAGFVGGSAARVDTFEEFC